VKLLQKFYGEAYTVQVEETGNSLDGNRRVNVRPSISLDDAGNNCNLPDNCGMPENDIFDKNSASPVTDKDLLPTSLFLVFLITGTHICAFGIISYMAMLERTWSCLVYSVIYVLIGTIYLLLTFSHGTAEKNRLKLCAGIVTKIELNLVHFMELFVVFYKFMKFILIGKKSLEKYYDISIFYIQFLKEFNDNLFL
jgi:hypothetical protein